MGALRLLIGVWFVDLVACMVLVVAGCLDAALVVVCWFAFW